VVASEPSPSSQAYVKGAVPPLTVAVNVTLSPEMGEDGVDARLDSRGPFTITRTAFEATE
jgi:hypothetical protein